MGFLFLGQDSKIELGLAVRQVVFLLDGIDFGLVEFMGSLELVILEIMFRMLDIAD